MEHKVRIESSKNLERFFDFGKLRKLPPETAYLRLLRIMAPPEVEAPPEEWLPHRIYALWRLTRTAALVLGICAEDETLDDATAGHERCPWTDAVDPRVLPSQQALLRRGAAGTFLSAWAPVAEPQLEPLALLPPAPDEPLERRQRWARAMGEIAQGILLMTTQRGRDGTAGLLDSAAAGYHGASAEQILALESALVDEAQRLVVEYGERDAVLYLRADPDAEQAGGGLGLSRKEALGLIRLAKAEALREAGGSVDEDRTLMVAQLKNLVARSRESMNVADELRAMKLLAAVQGLTRTDPENLSREFLKVIAAVAERQESVAPAPRVMTALPAPRPAPAFAYEPDTDTDEDHDALRQFDEEFHK